MNNLGMISLAEKCASKAKRLTICSGLDLTSIKQKVSVLLNHIGDHDVLYEYTIHDISHVNGVLNMIDKICSPSKDVLTQADWLMLVLAAYFHDLGMYVTREEYESRNNDDAYNEFLKNRVSDIKFNGEEEKYLYQEYIRSNHGNRVFKWITECNEHDEEPYKTINEILSPLDNEFRKDLAYVCMSHTEEELSEHLQSYNEAYGSSVQEKVNLLYVCIVLRCADLLHVTYERAPKDEYRIINPKHPVSQIEWQKQQAVKSVDVRREVGKDGNVDDTIMPHAFEIQAKFSDDQCYFSFMSYIDGAVRELQKCYKWNEESRKKYALNYNFPWNEIDTKRVEANGFNKRKLNFVIDQKNILQLLTGHTLYNDSTVVLRELIQNSIDACRLQKTKRREGIEYSPRIEVRWNSHTRDLVIADNGSGMSQDDIENYLLKVGASKYKSESFKKSFPDFSSISRFGIGLLTCFMICDNIDIYTYEENEGKCNLLKIRNLNGEYLMRNDADKIQILGGKHGTTFHLYVRPEIEMSSIAEQIQKWIVLPVVPVFLIIDDEEPIQIGYKSINKVLQTIAIDYCKILIDDVNYRICTIEDANLGVSFSCIQTRNKYTNVWTWYYIDTEREISIDYPIGLCIEGIRVVNELPGIESKQLIALVNCTGVNAPTTNVARDAIEAGENSERIIKYLFRCYMQVYLQQGLNLQKSNSLLWVNRELNYYINNFINNTLHINTKYLKVWDEVVDELPVFLIDDGELMQTKKINELPSVLFTDDSLSFAASINLLQDVKELQETPVGLLFKLTKGTYEKVPTLYDNHLPSVNAERFLNIYSPISLKVSLNEKRIQIKWGKEKENWYMFRFEDGSSYRLENKHMYILRSQDIDIQLIGTENNKILYTSNKIFILPGCALYEWLIQCIPYIQLEKNKYSSLLSWMSEQLISSHFERLYISRQHLYEEIDSDEDLELWKYVKREDIYKVIQESKDRVLDLRSYYHF